MLSTFYKVACFAYFAYLRSSSYFYNSQKVDNSKVKFNWLWEMAPILPNKHHRQNRQNSQKHELLLFSLEKFPLRDSFLICYLPPIKLPILPILPIWDQVLILEIVKKLTIRKSSSIGYEKWRQFCRICIIGRIGRIVRNMSSSCSHWRSFS